jgi:hypothetical protein
MLLTALSLGTQGASALNKQPSGSTGWESLKEISKAVNSKWSMETPLRSIDHLLFTNPSLRLEINNGRDLNVTFH